MQPDDFFAQVEARQLKGTEFPEYDGSPIQRPTAHGVGHMFLAEEIDGYNPPSGVVSLPSIRHIIHGAPLRSK